MTPRIRRYVFFFLIATACCGWEPAPLPEFRDIASAAGIKFQCEGSPTSQKYLIETMPGGVAAFDYDGDGNIDLYFVNGAALGDPQPPGTPPQKTDSKYWNRLFRNNGDGTFRDVTEKAGVQGNSYGMGAAVADYDNDGRPDLYVTNFGRNILYHNNGDGTFTDVTATAGVGARGWSSSAAFLDYDNDGWLDLVVTQYLDWSFENNPVCGARERRGYCHPNQFRKLPHILYHNNRDGTFTDVSKESGIAAHPGYGLGVAVNDYDGDGFPDILVANDNVPEQLFHNLGNGKFEEVALELGLAYDDEGKTFSGMGVDFADYNNDGLPDVFIGSLGNEQYALFRNTKGSFDYVTNHSGVGRISMLHSGWGLKFVDTDNDGWKDVFVAQGHVMDNINTISPPLRYREPMLLMHNEAGEFKDISARSGRPFQIPLSARGAAFADFNNDGFIDIAVSVLNGPALLLRNGGNANHYLIVNTVGTASNRDGIGAKLRAVGKSGLQQFGYVSTAGSYQSASDKRVHFGLGHDASLDLLEIRWPSGKLQTLRNVLADRIITVMEPKP